MGISMSMSGSFGQWVKECRKAVDLTQADLARQVGCVADTIRKIEADEHRPSRQMVERLAVCLEIPTEVQPAFIHMARMRSANVDMVIPTISTEQGLHNPPIHPNTHLPTQRNSFIGRAEERAMLGSLLQRADVRLLTLTGPPGIGKTRLALQVSADLLEEYEHGVIFVNLAAIYDPALVAHTIAQSLGVWKMAGQALVEFMDEYIRDKHLLLILDNFEQVMAATPQVTELLECAPRLNILVTSREVLHIYGEHEFVVPPLALPNPEYPLPLETLAHVPSVDLFVQRAHAVKPDFNLTPTNAPAVAEICARLDGLPLAIELAAARSKLHTPQAILTRLDHRLRLLTGGARDLPVRHQTLQHAIAWSYDLLAEDERALFRRISIFAGSCTVQAAAAICNMEGNGDNIVTEAELIPTTPALDSAQSLTAFNSYTLSFDDMLDRLASLVDKSLLSQYEEADGSLRFSMLETIREYALEELGKSGEVDEVRRRHANYYTTLIEESLLQTDWTANGSDSETINWLDREQDNLRSALDSMLECGDTELALRLSSALWESGVCMAMGARVAAGWTRS